jgi:GGDEF domain-containing protein
MQKLRSIDQQLQTAVEPETLVNAKLELAECLDQVRREAVWQSDPAAAATSDPVTHLMGRSKAEAVLVEVCASPEPRCAVITLLGRVRLYNRRYGRPTGDAVLKHFADFLKGAFEVPADLFRWSGPAILMIRPGVPDKVQSEVRRILEQKLNVELDTGSRAVMLPIQASWSVFPMMVDPRLLVNKIDSFVNA